MPSTLEFRQIYRQKFIPHYYRGHWHALFNFGLLACGLILCILRLERLKFAELLIVPGMFIIGNLTVYLIHRYPLHRVWKLIPYAYKAHTQWHHHFFTDEFLTFDSRRDWHIVFFPPIVVGSFLLFYVVPAYFLLPLVLPLNIAMLIVGLGCLYFLLYEIVHYASHLPEQHPWLQVSLLKKMRQHHKLHHNKTLMTHYNFNIVFPLCDALFGTSYNNRRILKNKTV